MYKHIYIYIYTCIHTYMFTYIHPTQAPAWLLPGVCDVTSRSGAPPPNGTFMGKCVQDVAKCCKPWQHVRTQSKV